MFFQFRFMAIVAIALLTFGAMMATANQAGINFSEDSYRSVRRLSKDAWGL